MTFMKIQNKHMSKILLIFNSVNEETVKCKNQFKGDFKEQIHTQALKGTEINLPIEAKLASSIWWNKLHIHLDETAFL